MGTLKYDIHREIEKILNQANKLKLDYTDVRIQNLQGLTLMQENGKLENISSGNTLGVGIRVIANGKPGFYSANDFNPTLAFKKALK